MSAGEMGVCLVCDKPIRDMASGGRPNENYTQVQVTWTNGSKMDVAVCKDCAKDGTWATLEGKKRITDWHWAYWDKQNGKYAKAVTVA